METLVILLPLSCGHRVLTSKQTYPSRMNVARTPSASSTPREEARYRTRPPPVRQQLHQKVLHARVFARCEDPGVSVTLDDPEGVNTIEA